MIELTKEQQQVVDHIIGEMTSAGFGTLPQFMRNQFIITVGGYAGTGKTTLLAYLRKYIAKSFPKICISFLTYTGKASSVLMSKLNSNQVDTTDDFIGTIHKLIYKPKTVWDRKLKCYVIYDWVLKDKDEVYTDLIIIDEGSMVSEKIWNDLLTLNIPIIVMGDHGQLPPIGDTFNLMSNPDFKLTEIHRQALNSPIIALSKFVREHGYVPFNRVFSKDVFKLSWNHPKCKKIWNDKVVFDENLIVLCAFNATRVDLNKKIRKKLGYVDKEIPMTGERIVCLQNDYKRGIMNGQIATLLWMMPEDHNLLRFTVSLDEYPDPIECTVSPACFGQATYTLYGRDDKWKKQFKYASSKGLDPIDFFDFGYTMSVHKSQGSEWNRVILFEQRTKHWDDELYAKWLYTGITRAREKLFIISDYWG